MRREKKNKSIIYVAVFIALIMITSVLGFIFGRSSEESMSYNKHDFYKKNLRWTTSINRMEVDFDYFPAEVDQINLSSGILASIANSRMVYVTYDPNQTNADELGFAQFEISRKLALLNIYAASGMTKTNTYGLPIITCENATQFVPVVVLNVDILDNKIITEGNCIILNGNPIKLKDRLLYGIFGVIENE